MSLPLLTNIRIFSLMALTSLIQLGMCIHSEYLRYQIMIMMRMRMKRRMRKRIWYLTMINFRQKSPSCWKACRVTTQKMLYFLTFVASRFLFSKSTWLSPLSWPPHSHPHPPYYHHHHHYHQLSHTFGIKNFVSLSIFFASFPSSFSSSSSSFSSASPSAVYERSTLPHLSWAPACLQVLCQHIIR